ncbi:MAG: 3D domain-containing protein [Defluviitaleaceae bacterium]|nr:3D domain-containing protein [Defluviitaleaceae bacterium]
MKKKIYRSMVAVFVVATIFLTGATVYQGSNFGVLLVDNGYARNIMTEAQTVLDMLDEMELTLHPFDIVTPPLRSEIEQGMTIEIERARPVYIRIDQNDHLIRFYSRPNSALSTVLNDFSRTSDYNYLLSEADSRYRPEAGEIVNISTVEWTRQDAYEEIPFEREYEINYRLAEGEEAIFQQGTNGLLRITYDVEFISGVEAAKRAVRHTIIEPPTPEIVHVGADLPPNHNISADGEIFSYSRLILMESTAYTLSFECTGRRPGDPFWGITASGMPVGVGVVAVDTNFIPFGTRMYIEGYGFAVAGDRGGAIRGYKVDVFMETMTEARQWGRKHNVRVWILD